MRALYLVQFLEYSVSNNGVTLKSASEVTQSQWKWYYSKGWVRFPLRIPYSYYGVFLAVSTQYVNVMDTRHCYGIDRAYT